jgi:hypothetical protein
LVGEAAGALGYELVRKHYYSPIPDLGALPPGVWQRESDLAGVRFDPHGGLAFVATELTDVLAEYIPPWSPTGRPRDFFLDNGFYGSVDAELLYAMVRRFAPSRIVELGSGMSSIVIADARAANGSDDGGYHRIFDPYPRGDLAGVLASIADLRAVKATDIPLQEFTALQRGDLLFVDTTHTVKIASDVNRIVLDVLPRLADGVIVHFHDIFLPWEYPREFMEERRFFWNEQYLLQAFLALNPTYEVLLSAYVLHRRCPSELSRLIRGAHRAVHPGALWLRRIGDSP